LAQSTPGSAGAWFEPLLPGVKAKTEMLKAENNKSKAETLKH